MIGHVVRGVEEGQDAVAKILVDGGLFASQDRRHLVQVLADVLDQELRLHLLADAGEPLDVREVDRQAAILGAQASVFAAREQSRTISVGA